MTPGFNMFLKTIYDDRFNSNKFKYISQCFAATLSIFLILLSLNVVHNDVIIATIGATSFSVFAIPHKNLSRSRYIIGGYLIGFIFGIGCSLVSNSTWVFHMNVLPEFHQAIFGAIGVGLTMFFMVLFNSEHPPAAALALGLVINQWTLRMIIVTVLALGIILTYRYIFRGYMIDLV